MEHENKTRIPAWLRPSTIRHMDGWLETANCKSRSEFIEKSLHFYMGYLGAEDASEYLSNALTATLRGIVADSANRTNSILFKCAVEQGIMAHTIAAHFGDAMEDRRALRGYVTDEGKSGLRRPRTSSTSCRWRNEGIKKQTVNGDGLLGKLT